MVCATHAVGFSADGQFVFSAGADKRVSQWTTEGLKKLRDFGGAEAPVKALAITRDGSRVAAGGDYAHARLWAVADGQPIMSTKLTRRRKGLALADNGR